MIPDSSTGEGADRLHPREDSAVAEVGDAASVPMVRAGRLIMTLGALLVAGGIAATVWIGVSGSV